MPDLTRRLFLAATASGVAARALPPLAAKPAGKRILTLVFDKSIGAMRAIDRVVN